MSFEDQKGTSAVREQHRFDEAALAAWMQDHVAGYQGPLIVEQFKGGQSNPPFTRSITRPLGWRIMVVPAATSNGRSPGGRSNIWRTRKRAGIRIWTG